MFRIDTGQVYLQHTYQDNTNDYVFRIDTDWSTYNVNQDNNNDYVFRIDRDWSTYNTNQDNNNDYVFLESIETGRLTTQPRQQQLCV